MSSIADTLFTNVHVFTADPRQPSAGAVAIQGERIAWVGGMDEARSWRGASTRVIDGAGCTLLPGFTDSHFHLLSGSLNLDDIHLEEAASYADFVATLQAYAAQHPGKRWLVGFGLRYNLGPEFTPLSRKHIDAVVSDRPVLITAYDYHTAWANTLALQEAGLLQGREVGRNSQVVLDEGGQATGELREDASDLVEALLPEPDEAQKREYLLQGIRLASQNGVTSVHNMDGDAEQASLYASLEEAGELTLRVYMAYSIGPETPFEAIEKEAALLKSQHKAGLLRCGSVKLFMDGVIEAYTGLLVDEYADSPGNMGGSNYTVEDFKRLVVEADRLGLQVCVHSVGDLGVRRVLDAYEAAQRLNGVRDSRHRIEHIEVVHPDDLKRFAGLGVIASMQPLHAPTSTDGIDIWPRRVGEGRWPDSFAWQSLRQAGARLVFGSDWPVASQNPLLGLHAACNRQPWRPGMPSQSQSLPDALLSYTRLAAYAEFEEQRKGQVTPGYLADLVLLSEDIFKTPAEALSQVKPVLTMLGGRIVYEGHG